jgi:hypothetical protein
MPNHLSFEPRTCRCSRNQPVNSDGVPARLDTIAQIFSDCSCRQAARNSGDTAGFTPECAEVAADEMIAREIYPDECWH